MINSDFYTIFWKDMLIIRRRFGRFIAASLVMPVLYLITFGWGLGRGIKMDGGTYLEFVLPGIIALSAMNSSFAGVSISLNISKLFQKTIEEIIVSPIRAYSIALGKVLSGCARGLLSSLLLIFLGLLLKVPLKFTLLFFIVLFITTFTFGSIAVIAAIIAKSHEDMSNFNSFFILPMSFLSGTFFSPEKLPEPFSSLILIYPLTHANLLLRAIALGHEIPYYSLFILLGYAAIAFYFAVRAIKRMEL